MKTNNFMEAVIIPLAQSFISGVLMAIVALLSIMVGNSLNLGWKILDLPFEITMLVASITVLLSWYGYRGNWNQRVDAVYGLTTRIVPEIKKKNPDTIHLNIYGETGGNFLNLPCSNEQLLAFAKAIINGKSFTVRSLTTGQNKIFTQNEYEYFRDELIFHGYARWKDGDDHRRGGVLLSAKGRAVMKAISEMETPYPIGSNLIVKRSNIR